MKALLIAFFASLFLATSVSAAEQIDLLVPDQVQSGTTTYTIVQVLFDWEQAYISIVLIGANGERKQVIYGQNTGARALIVAMNKMDFSTKSLHRTILEKLIADGHLTGGISGVPD